MENAGWRNWRRRKDETGAGKRVSNCQRERQMESMNGENCDPRNPRFVAIIIAPKKNAHGVIRLQQDGGISHHIGRWYKSDIARPQHHENLLQTTKSHRGVSMWYTPPEKSFLPTMYLKVVKKRFRNLTVIQNKLPLWATLCPWSIITWFECVKGSGYILVGGRV